MNIVGISGSPSAQSRSASLLELALAGLEGPDVRQHTIRVRDLPAASLVQARVADPRLREALDAVAAADLLVVATPIYKAAYSGTLKVFLDLLPQDGLRGKTVLPLGTAGAVAHLLALDYALKPVLSALGARDILDGVFATDAQLVPHEGRYVPDDALLVRLERSLDAWRGRSRVHTPSTAWRSAGSGLLTVADRCR